MSTKLSLRHAIMEYFRAHIGEHITLDDLVKVLGDTPHYKVTRSNIYNTLDRLPLLVELTKVSRGVWVLSQAQTKGLNQMSYHIKPKDYPYRVCPVCSKGGVRGPTATLFGVRARWHPKCFKIAQIAGNINGKKQEGTQP